jgi:hypothetical protein
MNVTNRSQVLVLGNYPVDRASFDQRYLTLRQVTIEQLKDVTITNTASGVLLTIDPKKPTLVASYFSSCFEKASDAGLVTIIRAKDRPDQAQAYAFRNAAYRQAQLFSDVADPIEREKQFESLPWIKVKADDWEIAEHLARFNPGPPIGSPEVVPYDKTDKLKPKFELFFKRAFHNCNRVIIRRLKGGRTAEGTFCVFANLDNGLYGPQPMPFFVKVDSYEMISREVYNYHEFVEPFIPFHLHPSIDAVRCVQTLTGGALVCDFVENAAPLRDALRSNQADGVIYALFEVTLRGIRSHTQNSPKMQGVLEAFLDTRVRAREIEEKHPTRVEKLRKRGMHRTPVEIEASLRTHATTIGAKQGLYHGDLHYSNVMVRYRDAIVIDFASMQEFGPLYADPAILEVSLIFGTDGDDDPKLFDAWCGFVDSIYLDPLRPPLPRGDHPQFAWLHRAVRELRQVIAGCGIEKKEALIILAGCMLRYARNPKEPFREFKDPALNTLAEERRAYAFEVAYRLCEQVEAL